MNLIEKLGLEKCKAIVDGAPRGASHHSISTNHYYKYDSFYGLWEEYWDIPNAPMWQRVFSMSQEGKLERMSDLRTAIADHERTDYCTDIRNHISNNTKVIER